jgi:iron(III) transport system permease protein
MQALALRGRWAWNGIRRPHVALGVVIVVALVVLVVMPVLEIALESLRLQGRDVRRFPDLHEGAWTGYYWQRVVWSEFSPRLFYAPLLNTLGVTVAFTLLAMLAGTLLAWLVARTDIPFKGTITACVVLPYVLPAWTIALAWTTMFRHDGQILGARGVFQQLTGLAVPDWLTYGAVPIVLVLVVNYYAYAYLLANAAFAGMNRQLEEAAVLHGAGTTTVLRRISLPIILPALVSAFVLTFCTGLGAFGVPYLLGLPADFEVLATYLYRSTQVGRYGEAYVLTVILILMAAITVFFTTRVIGLRQSFATLTGKGSSQALIGLGRHRRWLGWTVLVLVLIPAGGPILLMLLQSTQDVIGSYGIAAFTLDYWIGRNVRGFDGILLDGRVRAAAWNTFLISLVVGLVSVVAAFLAGYAIVKGRGTRMARLIEQIAFLPYLIPGVALGAVFLAMWSQPIGPFPSLYGTLAILILGCFVSQLPFAVRAGTSAMMQIGSELEEAGAMHARSWLVLAWRILLPLARNGLIVAFILTFISTAKELNLVIMLVTARTEMLSTIAIGFMDIAMEQFAHAIALVLVAITLLGTVAARLLARGQMQGRGG